MARPKKKGRKRGSKSQSIKTDCAVYHKPIFHHGSWRVRRRDLQTNITTMISLEAQNETQARTEVANLAGADQYFEDQDKLAPEDRDLNPAKLEAALEEWVELRDVRAITKQSYVENNRLFVKVWGAHREIHTIGLKEIENLMMKTWADRSPSTRIKRLNQLKRFYSWAIKRTHARSNPCALFEVPEKWKKSVRKSKENTAKPLSPDQYKKLLKECELEPELWLAVVLALRTGLRKSNLFGRSSGGYKQTDKIEHKRPLKWRDVDLEGGTLSLSDDLMKNDLDFEVPLNREVIELLRHKRDQKKIIDLDAPIIELKTPEKLFEEARSRAGLEEFRFHDLRTTFAVELAMIAPEMVVSMLLAHSKTTVTARYAQRIDQETLRTHLNKLPRIAHKTYVKLFA